jgi:hypothetical protein
MPLRFRRTVKIAPGVKLNLSKSGVSTTVGTKNIHFNFGKRGVKRTVSIPGTGISEVDYIKKNETEEQKEKAKERREERLEEKREEKAARAEEVAPIPATGRAAAHARLAAAPSTGLRNFFVLLAIVVFFFAGAAMLGFLPAHFFSNVFQWMAGLIRGSGL